MIRLGARGLTRQYVRLKLKRTFVPVYTTRGHDNSDNEEPKRTNASEGATTEERQGAPSSPPGQGARRGAEAKARSDDDTRDEAVLSTGD